MAVGEWDQRQLCPDGGCIGVIGPDGTCKTCGRVAPNWGDERNRGLLNPEDGADGEADDGADGVAADGDDDHDDDHYDDDDDEDGDADDDGDDEPDEDGDGEHRVAGGSGGGEWTSRALCPDGGCVGVIGDDGRCKVCGRAAVEPAHAVDPPAPADAAEPHDKGAS